MRMKLRKTIILVGMLLAIVPAAFAEQRGVFMEFHRKINPGKNMQVNRAPMRLPIEVVYDTDTHKIQVIGDEFTKVEVFLYKADGTLENCSSKLNTEFTGLTSGTYSILIQGKEWNAEGEIEI